MGEEVRKRKAFIGLATFFGLATSSVAQVLMDAPYDRVLRANAQTTLDDLSINDTALIYRQVCLEGREMKVMGWAEPSDLANSTYNSSGILLKVTVLPGRRLRGTFVDAAQAQAIAKGNPSAPPVLSESDLKKEVREWLGQIYEGGYFGMATCEQTASENPLREMTLFTLDSLNGATTISELLDSVGG